MIWIIELLFAFAICASGQVWREFGYVFPHRAGFIQGKYSTLCNASSVRFEIYFNTTAGIAFFAENKNTNTNVLVYYRQPEIFFNASFNGRKFSLSYTHDFFNSAAWIGWHDFEIMMGLTRLGFVYDRRLREGAFDHGFLFPEKEMETNMVFFGGNGDKNGLGFIGLMRNFQYKSCGCDEWRPLVIVRSSGINLNRLGDCAIAGTCAKGCTCLLKSWGARQCDCSSLYCPVQSDDISFGFDNPSPPSLGKKELTIVNTSVKIQYGEGIFDQSMLIGNGSWIVLTPSGGGSCFKTVFLCEEEWLYQFWIKPHHLRSGASEYRNQMIIKHAPSLESPYGLEIIRTNNNFQFVFITNANQRFELISKLPLLLWNRVTISFNRATLKLSLNDQMIHQTNSYSFIDHRKPNIITTKYLFVGSSVSNPSVEIDQMIFSTDSNVPRYPSIQIMKLELSKTLKKINANCKLETRDYLVDATRCFDEIFKQSNFSLGFYMGIIFNKTNIGTTFVKSSVFQLQLLSPQVVQITLPDGQLYQIRLRKTESSLVYLELSITKNNKLLIHQDIDFLLRSFDANLKMIVDYSLRANRRYINVHGFEVVELTIINVPKDLASRSLRIPTSRPVHYSMDFDDLNPLTYSTEDQTEGYVGYGMTLKHPNNFINLQSMDRSCVANTNLCYNGLTISFWISMTQLIEDPEVQFTKIFSSGVNGIDLLMDNHNNFILLLNNTPVSSFTPSQFVSLFNQWNYLELTMSANKVFSLFINGLQTSAVTTVKPQLVSKCTSYHCFSDENLIVDEIKIWDVGRNFLVANGFILSGQIRSKLYSFTDYQMDQDFALNGSATIIATKLGQGLSLHGSGTRYAAARIPTQSECFSKIDSCRRGILIRLLVRIDDLSASIQTFVSSPQVVIGAKLGSLFVHLYSSDRCWSFQSGDLLRIFRWYEIGISWILEGGMKVFINEQLVGHIKSPVYNKHESSVSQIYFGKDLYHSFDGNPAALIDDYQMFETNQNDWIIKNKWSCFLVQSFDGLKTLADNIQLGINGNAGLFSRNSSIDRKIPIPSCFNDLQEGCKDCFTLQMWVYFFEAETELFQMKRASMRTWSNNIIVAIDRKEKLAVFVCPFDDEDLVRNWNFLELSWDEEEGLLVFVNRELLSCRSWNTNNTTPYSMDYIEISREFYGMIDELEMHRSRITPLYWNKVVKQSVVESLINKLREKKQRENARNMDYEAPIEFNGTTQVKVDLPATSKFVPGSTEEIDLIFKSFDTFNKRMLWVLETGLNAKMFYIHKHKFYFSILASQYNGSKMVIEDVEIFPELKSYTVYRLKVLQKAQELIMKISSIDSLMNKTIIGRDSLIPKNTVIYLGGYEQSNNFQPKVSDSSFVGVIYEARTQSNYNRQSVDIISEVSKRLKPASDTKSRGNFRSPLKEVLARTNILFRDVVNDKVPIMITNPFLSINLPKWDFDLISNVEIEFATLESRGSLIFIGNVSHYIFVEIFDSHLFFHHKMNNNHRRISITGHGNPINDNKPHNIYLGRDISGNIKAFLDKKVVISKLPVPGRFSNSISIIGYVPLHNTLPGEILSHTGFMGCIHFIRIADRGFLKMFRSISISNHTQNEFKLPFNFGFPGFSDICETIARSSCSHSPCQDGTCEQTQIGLAPRVSENFKCNCLFAQKALDNDFRSSSAIDNFDKWVANYLFESRSRSCSQESPQIPISDRSVFTVDFIRVFPFVSVLDLEFLLLTKTSYGCISSLIVGDPSSRLEILIERGVVKVETVNKLFYISNSDVTVDNGVWHGIQIHIRPGFIRLQIDNSEKESNFLLNPSLQVSRIYMGHCTNVSSSDFVIRNLVYNNLHLYPNLHETSPTNLFYRTGYASPDIQAITLNAINTSPNVPVTLFNNFYNALMKYSIKITWLVEFDFHITIRNTSGSLVHIINGDKFISVILCGNNGLALIYKDGQKDSERFLFPFTESTVRVKIIIDKIRSALFYEDLIKTSKTQLVSNIDVWKIDDPIRVEFGINENFNRMVLLEEKSLPWSNFLNNAVRQSFYGCIQKFIITNGRDIHNINEKWNQIMLSSPPTSVIIGVCKDVDICLPNTCIRGQCKSTNYIDVFCDCSKTEFMGDKCHLPKPQCTAYSCKNRGKCVLVSIDSNLMKTNCICSGTGFTGEHCGDPICQSDTCLNNGRCSVIEDNPFCNCTSTGYYGSRCENSFCDLKNCNNRGSCFIDRIIGSPVCHCNLGFFGENCDTNQSSKCANTCLNGGVCSFYRPVMKLCPTGYCQDRSPPECSCDHTIYRGQACNQPEFGFNPNQDGIVVMDRAANYDNTYFRILFEPFRQKDKSILLQYSKTLSHFFYLYMTYSNTTYNLWLRYVSEGDRIRSDIKIGTVKPVNTLLVVENQSTIRYYFNSVFGGFSLPKNSSVYYRRKRNVDGNVEKYPRVYVGSNSEYDNTFDGLIAGVQWNDLKLLDGKNKLWKRNTIHSIESLNTKTFPHIEPFLIIPRRKEFPILVLLIVFVLECLIFAFCVMLKLRSRGDKKFDMTDKPDKVLLMENHKGDSLKSAECVSIESEKIIATTAVMAASSLNTIRSDTTRIVLVDEFMNIDRLVVIDMVIVIGTGKAALVINKEPQIPFTEKLFPIDDSDYEYKCVRIEMSTDRRYVYGHMKNWNSLDEEDLVELQVWSVAEKWTVSSRPPNVCFTSSVSTAAAPSHLLLINHYCSTITMWNLDTSNVIWSSSFHDTSSRFSSSTSLEGNLKSIFINCEKRFQIVKFGQDQSSFQINCGEFPSFNTCLQLISIKDTHYLIRTESEEVHLYNIEDQSFERRVPQYKVGLISKLDWNNETSVAMALNTGEVYMTNDIINTQYCKLGPKNKSKIVCLSFSSDASMISAGYETNLIHLWRVSPDISLCHFHAIHSWEVMRSLQFSENKKFIVATFPTQQKDSNKMNNDIKLRVIRRY